MRSRKSVSLPLRIQPHSSRARPPNPNMTKSPLFVAMCGCQYSTRKMFGLVLLRPELIDFALHFAQPAYPRSQENVWLFPIEEYLCAPVPAQKRNPAGIVRRLIDDIRQYAIWSGNMRIRTMPCERVHQYDVAGLQVWRERRPIRAKDRRIDLPRVTQIPKLMSAWVKDHAAISR